MVPDRSRLLHLDGTEKNGSSIVLGALPDGIRRRGQEEKPMAMSMLCLDFDLGWAFDAVVAKMQELGLHCVVATTFSHLTATTSFNASDFHKWQAAHADDPLATIADYLVARGKTAEVADGARLLSDDDKAVVIEHRPCPKARVYIPLARPWSCRHDEFGLAVRAGSRAPASPASSTIAARCSAKSGICHAPRKSVRICFRFPLSTAGC